MKAVKKFFRGLFVVEKYVGMALLIGMVVSVVLQVLSRYVVGKPLNWTEEASRFLFIWLIMLMIGHCIPVKAHMKVELFVDLLPQRLQIILTVFMKLATLAFFIYLIPHTWKLALAQHRVRSTALQLPYSYIYGSVTLGSVLAALHMIENLLFDTKWKPEEHTK